MRSTNQNGSSTFGEHEPKPGAGPKRIIIAPHWAAILGLVAIGVLYALLPTKVSIGYIPTFCSTEHQSSKYTINIKRR